MSKDTRYTTIQDLILKGYITSLTEIFEKELITRSRVARDLGLNPARFSRNLKNPQRFSLKDLYAFAAMLEVERMTVLNLADNDFETGLKKMKRKK
jgi:hypothetical protein